jgi:signal transduction histidine kinase
MSRFSPIGIGLGAIFLAGCNFLAGGISVSAAPVAAPLLTSAQIREISPEEADKHYPVHIRGVVTFADWNADWGMFLQDETAGIYVVLDQNGNFAVGDEVELDGVTMPGDYVPSIRTKWIRKLGTGSLPDPIQASYTQMASGQNDSQWVQVEGVVRSAVESTKGRTRIDLLVDGERLSALVGQWDVTNAQKMVCATIRVRGVCRTRYNRKRQIRAPYLSVTSPADIRIEAPASDKPVEVPIASLLQFKSEGYYGRRVAVRGVVTEQKGSTLFIQDHDASLYVRSPQNTTVVPGDVVHVTGFPALGQYAPVLEDSVYEVVGHEAPPKPQDMAVEQLLTQDFDLALVRLQGKLINRVDRYDEEVLVLDSENLVLSAHLDRSKADDRIMNLQNGSVLELTGVSLAQPEENWNPSLPSHPVAFQLLLRSANDVVLLSNPPWWTLSRLCWVLGALAAAVLAGFAWVFVLDRRVRAQTDIIQQKVHREAMLEERTRIAREFHDTLEQELAAITIQLDAVAAQFDDAPGIARHLLELARTMSRRSLLEARRSVWDLRSHLLESSNLVTALSEVAKLMTHSAQTRIEVRTSGPARKLTAPVESNLLRIAQEALANAMKHAGASHIIVKLIYEKDRVQLRVCDDGAGFDTAHPAGPSEGHFGLLDMRERAGKIGAAFSMVSAPGQGTEVIVTAADKGVAAEGGLARKQRQEEKIPAA